MSDTAATALRKTPLHARHCASNARMVSFGGWEMPVEYSGITAEHMAVRTRAGLFDVSHMGEIEIAGKDALAAGQRISSNDASRLQVGQAHYSALTTFDGTFVDDLLVYRMAPNHFMLVVNASNIAKDYAWISAQIKEVGEAAAVDSSSRYAVIASQGPAGLGGLREQKEKGLTRKLVGFEMIARGIARHGYQVVHGEKPIGVVTSGTQTPFLKKAIGMAYVPMELTPPGSEITVDVRGRTSR